jgi:hypothetical protein
MFTMMNLDVYYDEPRLSEMLIEGNAPVGDQRPRLRLFEFWTVEAGIIALETKLKPQAFKSE